MLTRKALLVVFIVLSLVIPTLAAFPVAQSPEQDETTIKINTELVNFDIQALNKKTGRPINGLMPENFEIYENGVKQTISNFSQDKLPLSVLIMLDVSGSVEGISTELREATIKALNLLKPEDEVSLMAFATGVGALNTFTRDKKIIIDNIENVRLKTIAFGRSTAFNDATYQAIDHIKQFANPGYRKVIVTITDNIVLKPLQKEKQEVITTLLEAGITMNGLLVEDTTRISPIPGAQSANRNVSRPNPQLELIPGSNTTINPRSTQGGPTRRPNGRGQGTMRSTVTPDIRVLPEERPPVVANSGSGVGRDVIDEYVQETGGEIIDARKAPIEEKFVELIEHLRARYSVGFVSSNTKNDGKLRKLKIKVVSSGKEINDVAVKTKRGYFTLEEK